MKNEKGFTLIEMLIVLMVISVILLIAIPNVTKNNQTINEKGCQALEKMVEAQVQVYRMENNEIPTLQELIDKGYLKNDTACPNGDEIYIDPSNGEVTTKGESNEPVS